MKIGPLVDFGAGARIHCDLARPARGRRVEKREEGKHPHYPLYRVYSVYKPGFAEGFCMLKGLHRGLQGFTKG